ncbi:lipid IV(A) 3-deoxy-D-manno-octulosonic acid transferase [Endozoicomonas sp. G2_1]|uniref:lipid IV(A) 3-deoxy-D-manno-octulosonic acid transferase n=1 Tax=Endozoicomonas sp. G2_1 TaxID=2821091 RepID=UPI001ADBA752|nr:lipid IV(A) 3-deoxy-D-manno-octulosonic acid transferase [Endozoicomonas sp. G2_1]
MFALFLYRLLFLLLLPVLLIALLVRSRSQKAYRARISERLGLASLERTDILIHAASVGEVLALKQFVNQLIAEQPALKITFTTFTPTGSEQVTKLFGDRVQHCYLPLDIWPCTQLFLAKLQPKTLVFMETELWPNLVAQAKSRGCKLLLINGRLSAKSTPKYKKLSALISPCLQRFDAILCQSHESLERFLSLGAAPANTQYSGNLKYDIEITKAISEKQQELAAYLSSQGTSPNDRKVWLVASTHPGDNEIVLAAFKQLLAHCPDLLLIVVPRHPERFNQVAELCQQTAKTVRRSDQQAVSAHDNIWLLDSLGELSAAFGLADIITMGGSFSSVGGHNPLEPALFKKAIITGPNMSNFSEVQAQLLAENGVIQLADDNNISGELAERVNQLLTDNELAKTLGQNALTVVKSNQGAIAKTLTALNKLLN